MSVARFIADQRTRTGCHMRDLLPDPGCQRFLVLQVARAADRPTGSAAAGDLDAAVQDRSSMIQIGTYGSPRIHADLLEAGWRCR